MEQQFAIYAGRGKRRRMIGPFATEADACRYSDTTFHPETWLVLPIDVPQDQPRETTL